MTGGIIRHGHSMVGNRSAEHRAWTGMKQRCENPNNPKFHRYGGRGIYFCERWRSFDNFILDMGPRPAGFSIERKNNNGNYEPGNCIWASRKTQQRNRSACRRVEYLGNEMTLFEAVALSKTTIPYTTIYHRIIQGWDLTRAMTEAVSQTLGRKRIPHPKRERVGA